MNTLVRPSLSLPPVCEVVEEEHLACEERKIAAHDMPENWISRMMLKSYISSFNFALSQLGWVPQRILEVGSGDGTLLSYLGQNFMNSSVQGIEFDADKIAHAKERNCCRIEFIQLSEAETLPFKSDSFDVVISHGFLGLSNLPHHWVKEMCRVSAEGIIISTPTPLSYNLMKLIPGTSAFKLIGNSVFSPQTTPLPLKQLCSWLERLEFCPEVVTMPAPYGLIMARKPQKD
jgi:ubiquinone/menaquinone biosynthesis C-methylase UbiE